MIFIFRKKISFLRCRNGVPIPQNLPTNGLYRRLQWDITLNGNSFCGVQKHPVQKIKNSRHIERISDRGWLRIKQSRLIQLVTKNLEPAYEPEYIPIGNGSKKLLRNYLVPEARKTRKTRPMGWQEPVFFELHTVYYSLIILKSDWQSSRELHNIACSFERWNQKEIPWFVNCSLTMYYLTKPTWKWLNSTSRTENCFPIQHIPYKF